MKLNAIAIILVLAALCGLIHKAEQKAFATIHQSIQVR